MHRMSLEEFIVKVVGDIFYNCNQQLLVWSYDVPLEIQFSRRKFTQMENIYLL